MGRACSQSYQCLCESPNNGTVLASAACGPADATTTLGLGAQPFPGSPSSMAMSSTHLVLGFGTGFLPNPPTAGGVGGGQVWIYKKHAAGDFPAFRSGIMDASQWPYAGTSRFGGFGIQLALSESYLAVTTTVAPR